MNTKHINEILMEYERDKTIAEETAYKRQLEVYKKIPRIKQIDTDLASMGFEIARTVLKANTNIESLIDGLKQKSMDLKIERAELLSQNKYPLDYTSSQYKCNACKDTGYIGADKCHCFKQKIIDRYYNQSNLKSVLEKENFDTFVFDYYSTHKFEGELLSPRKNIENIYGTCINFVEKFDTSSENLFFYGSSGLGKTFLSNCMAKDLLDRGKLVVYQTAPGLIDTLRELTFNNSDNSAKDKANDILNCDLLVIDDLGTEYYKTEFCQMELYNVINKRLISGKKMVISTNLYLDEILSAYAERLTSRILGNFTICKFYGEDIRVKIAGLKKRDRKK